MCIRGGTEGRRLFYRTIATEMHSETDCKTKADSRHKPINNLDV